MRREAAFEFDYRADSSISSTSMAAAAVVQRLKATRRVCGICTNASKRGE